MKTCQQFTRIRSGYETDIRFLINHSARHQGTVSGKVSAKNAIAVKRKMAKALNWHIDRCPECG